MSSPEPNLPEFDVAPRGRQRRTDVSKLFDALQAGPEVSRAKTLVNSLGDRFVLIPEGTFAMGSTPDEPGARSNEFPRHDVVLSHAFYMGILPVTQESYFAVTGRKPSKYQPKPPQKWLPVENVSWDDAVAYCQLLSARPAEVAGGYRYRLPREAEWEYAARSGAKTTYAFGDLLSPEQARFASEHPAPADRAAANSFGLHGLHGGVWEWCADYYGESFYADSPIRDPEGSPTGKFRVLRGGSWRNLASCARAAYRNALAPHQHDSTTGFRVVIEIAATPRDRTGG
jgi:formylglycine-generating enzyme required for sulfatase activity